MPLSSLLQVFRSRRLKPADALRVGVLGAGRMGQHHIRHVARHPRARLAGIVDTDPARVRPLARKFRAPAYSRPEELLGQVDAVIIATPTPTHSALGQLFLGAGISCLVEKPLATNVGEAEALLRLANEKQAVLQVGHIERFNPAVIEAARHIEDPRFIEVNRLGPYDPRVAHIGVVLDLMIHDLDIVLFLVGKPVVRVEAFGARLLSDHEDIAKVRLHFAGGCIADLSASRVSMQKYRYIRIFQKASYLSLDYAKPRLKIYRKRRALVQNLLQDVELLRPKLAKREPLALEIDHFIQCVREGREPLVTGQHGRDALELASEVLRNLKIDE